MAILVGVFSCTWYAYAGVEETGVFAPPSPFYNNELCVGDLQVLVASKPPQGVLVRGQAGLVINELSR